MSGVKKYSSWQIQLRNALPTNMMHITDCSNRGNKVPQEVQPHPSARYCTSLLWLVSKPQLYGHPLYLATIQQSSQKETNWHREAEKKNVVLFQGHEDRNILDRAVMFIALSVVELTTVALHKCCWLTLRCMKRKKVIIMSTHCVPSVPSAKVYWHLQVLTTF